MYVHRTEGIDLNVVNTNKIDISISTKMQSILYGGRDSCRFVSHYQIKRPYM